MNSKVTKFEITPAAASFLLIFGSSLTTIVYEEVLNY
jgi:hypothetical protein